jgi:type IV secretion system protein VirB6
MANYSLLIEQVLTEVDVILKTYVHDGYQALTSYLEVPLGLLIVLFYVVYGVSLTQGWVKGSVSGFVKSVFKVGLIYYFGMNWGHFSQYVSSLFYEASGHIGDVLINASPIKLPDVNGAGINAALQTVFTEIMQIGQWIIDAGGWTNWGPAIGGVGVLIAGWVLVGYAILEIIIAKCMLSILFVVSPLFIAFTVFKPTHTFFDRWLGACVGYALLMIFISAGLGIVVALDYWALAGTYALHAENMSWIDIGVVILVTFVCFGILRHIALLALSIGGTVRTLSGNSLIAGTVGGFMGGAAGAKAVLQHMKDPTSLGRKAARASSSALHSPLRAVSDTASSIAKNVMHNLRNGDTPPKS